MAPDWWVSGEEGKLPPIEQAKLWALVTMSARFGLKLSPNKMKDVVKKVGGQPLRARCPVVGADLQGRSRLVPREDARGC